MEKGKLGLGWKITWLIVTVCIINLIVALLISYKQLEQAYINASLKGNVDLAVNMIAYYEKRAKNGEYTAEEGKRRAVNAVAALKFSNDTRIFMLDNAGVIIKHPSIESGIQANEIVDTSGKIPVYKNLVDGALKSKNGYGKVEYLYAESDSDKSNKELAMSKFFPDWNIIVAMSITKHDINQFIIEQLKTTTVFSIIAAVLIAAVVQFTFITYITKILTGITGSLENSTYSVSDSATRLEESSHKLAQGSSQQASSLQEIVATIEESTSMIRKTDESSKYASELSQKSKINAEKSFQEMNKLMGAMDKINESSQEISKIIKVIDQIALQTNILSLNAAVEAEKAGEAGRGFAVVAEEVRNLANKSAQSAKDTARLIENSVETCKDATLLVKHVHNSIREIEEQTNKVDALISEVAVATREQKIGMEQINQAIAQVDNVLQLNSKTAAETSEDSQRLSDETNKLDNVAGELISFVNGSE